MKLPHRPLSLSGLSRSASIRAFVAISCLIVSAVTFLVVVGISVIFYLYQEEQTTSEFTASVSRQSFGILQELMQKGWNGPQLHEMLERYRGSLPTTTTISLYRNEQLAWQSVDPDRPRTTEAQVLKVFSSGAAMKEFGGGALLMYTPLVAEKKCLGCHNSVTEGSVLAVLKVSSNLSASHAAAFRQVCGVFLLLSPMPLLMAWFLSRRINRHVSSAFELLRDKITAINRMDDLTSLNMTDQRVGLWEFDRLFAEMGDLIARIRSVAVGKEMLEFEIRVLERFIITSDSVKDWKERVCFLLLELNKVMPVYTLFCVFQVDEELYDIEIFWKSSPSPETSTLMEQTVRSRINREMSELAVHSSLSIVHTVADLRGDLLQLDATEIDMQTKSLLLKNPRIGGVVGIGVQTRIAEDPIRCLVIDSILTTLLNVVGSIKAIYKYTRELEYYATRDPLTNLFNQRIFWELLGYEISRAARHRYHFGLLVIDLDNFKQVNDTYGHIFGDKFLVQVADVIHGALRKGDILARYGGDEFSVVLPEADEEQVYLVATRIKDALEALVVPAPDGTPVRGTASIGMAVYPTHADNEKDLFMFADNMTYKAKAGGKNRVLVPTDEDVVHVFKRSSELSKLLIKTIEEKRVIPYFQPIVSTATGEILCHELLCRIEVEGEIMPAGDFIETAERLGIVCKLDCILMEKLFARMQADTYQGMIFINLSPRSLIMQEFIPTVIRLSHTYGIAHDRIVFELTERETVRNVSLLETFVTVLKLEGFKFAIDDFGAGFSSFQYVRRLPIDFVKIDGDFIREMLDDGKDYAFVKTLAVLAREFGIQTIAEYIENEELFRAISELEIDFGQGYHLGPPSPDLLPVGTIRKLT
ncbi:putative bifunctional diguanylate cyclase/phosphodiesterase [Trichlorobacter ammonificans]|uniref:Diguanylate cyclase n=1 Tax=Trichlorobacter ammonificans TaxID=2916410 RepID=A0ABM9D4W3_9BACT|nr:bifunctional diguanylate cyclase/phosphodiesterase [Trichlorobacter ammonificans]CAH2030271.1 putative Diguanylate cyclase [Trichlorobacter ammonificans]